MQILVESVLRAHVLLVGDPELLPQLELPADGITPTPNGNTLVVHVPASAHVSVAGSDRVESVRLLLDLDAPDTALEPRGHVDCPSGRLVIGSPEAIAAWGESIEPDDGLMAQARAYTARRRHLGHVVIARVPCGRHQTFTAGGGAVIVTAMEALENAQLLVAS
jgi:hypothetical protein